MSTAASNTCQVAHGPAGAFMDHWMEFWGKKACDRKLYSSR